MADSLMGESLANLPTFVGDGHLSGETSRNLTAPKTPFGFMPMAAENIGLDPSEREKKEKSDGEGREKFDIGLDPSEREKKEKSDGIDIDGEWENREGKRDEEGIDEIDIKIDIEEIKILSLEKLIREKREGKSENEISGSSKKKDMKTRRSLKGRKCENFKREDEAREEDRKLDIIDEEEEDEDKDEVDKREELEMKKEGKILSEEESIRELKREKNMAELEEKLKRAMGGEENGRRGEIAIVIGGTEIEGENPEEAEEIEIIEEMKRRRESANDIVKLSGGKEFEEIIKKSSGILAVLISFLAAFYSRTGFAELMRYVEKGSEEEQNDSFLLKLYLKVGERNQLNFDGNDLRVEFKKGEVEEKAKLFAIFLARLLERGGEGDSMGKLIGGIIEPFGKDFRTGKSARDILNNGVSGKNPWEKERTQLGDLMDKGCYVMVQEFSGEIDKEREFRTRGKGGGKGKKGQSISKFPKGGKEACRKGQIPSKGGKGGEEEARRDHPQGGKGGENAIPKKGGRDKGGEDAIPKKEEIPLVGEK